jgi:hypothetical protein
MKLHTSMRIVSMGLAALLLTHCGQKKETPLPTLYKVDDIERNTLSLATDLGIPVVLDSANEFDSEYRVAFVLRHLDKNKDALKPYLVKVQQIILGRQFSSDPVGDKYTLTINIYATPSSILKFLQEGVDAAAMTADMRALSTRLGVNVVDGLGVTPAEYQALKAKLDSVAGELLLRQDTTFRTLVLFDQTQVLSDGATIDMGLAAETLIRDLREVVDARIFAQQHLTDISQKLGIQISYQQGVFSGVELRRAVENLRLNEKTIRLYNRRVGHLILGRRWDEQPNSRPLVLLVDSFVIGDAFEAALRSYQLEPNTPVLTGHLDVLKVKLAERQLFLESVVTEIPATVQNESALKILADSLAKDLDVAVALTQGMKAIQVVAGEVVEYSPVTGILLVGLNSTVQIVNETLRKQWVSQRYRWSSERLQAFAVTQTISLELASDMQPQSGDSVEQLKVTALEAVETWVVQNLVGDTLVKTPVARLRLVKNTIEKTSYDFKAKYLLVNLSDFKADDMKNILKEPPTPKPAPAAPAPAPTPAPGGR